MNFNYTYNPKVNSTYIIKIRDNLVSELLAQRCYESCIKVGQPNVQFYSGIDGTGKDLIIYNYHSILELIKKTNTTVTQAELACFLSHFLLWVKCVELDEPIVILEHDAIMLQQYLYHPFFNIISYLGCIEQMRDEQFIPQYPMPPQGQLNPNFRFILRAHAYAIDPMIARQLVAKVIKYGIFTSADVFIRIDEFAIIQSGLYAYDCPGITTIPGRDEIDKDEEYFKFRSLMLCE